MKVVALYLPQFHTIPENDTWWGEGFTEWVNIKKAIPLFENHHQPRIPLQDNYYNLADPDVMRWQASIAKEHGVYGFCFYHYWFDGKLLLQKPIENFLENKDIDIHFCISWANEHWTDQWVSEKWNVLIEQRYGERDEWKVHFDYLLPYFKDDRYIKVDEKPVFVIYRPHLIDKRAEMLAYWNQLAEQEGFKGMCFVFQRAEILLDDPEFDFSMFDFAAVYQPGFAASEMIRKGQCFRKIRKLKRNILGYLEKHIKFDSRSISLPKKKNRPRQDNYDEIWNHILNDKDIFPNIIPTAFTDWDNTPRRGEKGSVVIGASPDKFEEYFTKLIRKAQSQYKTDLIFIFAWNEWAEGGYLEPDELNGFGYLRAIYKALQITKELP